MPRAVAERLRQAMAREHVPRRRVDLARPGAGPHRGNRRGVGLPDRRRQSEPAPVPVRPTCSVRVDPRSIRRRRPRSPAPPRRQRQWSGPRAGRADGRCSAPEATIVSNAGRSNPACPDRRFDVGRDRPLGPTFCVRSLPASVRSMTSAGPPRANAQSRLESLITRPASTTRSVGTSATRGCSEECSPEAVAASADESQLNRLTVNHAASTPTRRTSPLRNTEAIASS